ncbi:hypothetical protein RMATCC62417_13646 [Rhizopus microsporus]|nr:hypothetical protein RMATCC62417_13646 [Rhizopus microsporus]
MSLMKQPMSISCAHMFCKQCIETKMQQKATCPLCNHLIKHLHPMPNIQIIIDEFMKLKQEYQVDDPFIDTASLSTEEDKTLVTSLDIKNAQARAALQTQENSLPIQEKECRILKKGHKPELNIPNMIFVDKMNTEVTHIVLPADKHNIVDRSLTYYLGILYGCFIVNEQWLENCIKRGHIIPESRYEISGDRDMGRTGAPEKARKNKEAKKPNLFRGLKVCVIDDDLQRQVEKCILAGGGIVEDSCQDVIVCSDDPESKRQELKDRFTHRTLLLKSWIFDSICNFELLKKDDYYL